MQFIADGHEVQADSYDGFLSVLKSQGRLPTAVLERNRFMVNVRTTSADIVAEDIKRQLAEMSEDADSLMLSTSLLVASESPEAAIHVNDALAFWRTLTDALDTLHEIGRPVGTIERIHVIADAVKAIESAESPEDIYPVFTTLASEAEWWHRQMGGTHAGDPANFSHSENPT